MDDQARHSDSWAGFVDWKSKPVFKSFHGGVVAASFVLGVEVLENLAFLACASNLVLYFSGLMHFPPSHAATAVTNFMGTAFLLALLGGFLADAFFTTYSIFLISSAIEFVGLVILAIQARTPVTQAPKCSPPNTCVEVDGPKKAILFAGLYLVALGVGGVKGSLPPHGAHQFDESTARGRKLRSAFFSYFVFCLSCGALVAVTLVVWVEDNVGWQWGFGIAGAAVLFSIPLFLLGSPFYRIKVPAGSPIITMFKVLAAATCNSFRSRNSSSAIVTVTMSGVPSLPPDEHCPREDGHDGVAVDKDRKNTTDNEAPKESLAFLDMALLDNPNQPKLKCSAEQVEEAKAVTKILPIFASTVMLNACLAQLSTLSVQQAATMDTALGALTVPPASLPVVPVLFIMTVAPLYSHVIAPFARRRTGTEAGITHLQRIGAGLVMSVAAMAVAAIVEVKRRHAAEAGERPVPMTFMWLAWQYLFLGSADLFTLAGIMEFFFTEAPPAMRSLATALSWASLAVGYYLSSFLVSVVNAVTATALFGRDPWLAGADLNSCHLERFYWVMCGLSGLNFLHFLFWASRYKYTSLGDHN